MPKLSKTGEIMEAMSRVLILATELCDSIDAGEVDVGGHRSSAVILRELGPVVDKANKLKKAYNTQRPFR